MPNPDTSRPRSLLSRVTWSVFGAALIAALCAPAAAAQVRTMPVAVCEAPLAVKEVGGSTFIDALTTLYNEGRRDALAKLASAFLDRVKAQHEGGCPGRVENRELLMDSLSGSRHYIGIGWVGEAPLSGKAVFMRVVLHDAGKGVAVGTADADLPGIAAAAGDPQLVEVFVGRARDASVSSVYTSAREKDPMEAKLPAFVQAVAAPMFAIIGAVAGEPAQEEKGARRLEEWKKAQEQDVWVTVSRVGLTYSRASVRLQVSARDAVDGATFAKGLADLAAAATMKEAAYSPCARSYAKDLARTLAAAVGTGACAPDQPASSCAAALDALMVTAYGDVATCRAQKTGLDAVQAVDRRFRAHITTESSVSAEANLTFHNRPLTHWSLGAGVGVISHAATSRTRAKLTDAGLVTGDPMSRTMTTAFVNWSPKGYDESAPRVEPAERYRLFLGAALTPDFGIVAGLNTLLARGIGVSAGVGLLFATGADTAQLDKKPTDSADPFKLAFVKIVHFGITYNFK